MQKTPLNRTRMSLLIKNKLTLILDMLKLKTVESVDKDGPIRNTPEFKRRQTHLKTGQPVGVGNSEGILAN